MDNSNKSLLGRGIVITGANQGLGRSIALECVKEGADVLICARDLNLLHKVQTELREIAESGQTVIALNADISQENEVIELFNVARNELPNFIGLVNNAGIYGPKGNIEEVDWREWVQTININLLGTVLCCRQALVEFKKNGYGKIVNLSGGGATTPLPFISAYAASKAAVVRFTETIAEELKNTKIEINALAPGALNTRLLEEVIAAGPQKVGSQFYQKAVVQKENGGSPLETGAECAAFLLSNLSDGISGRLISAIWDAWRDLPAHLQDLKQSDVYTLRRIVPKDRNLSWSQQ